MDGYDVIVWAHIASAMVWVGGGFVVVAVQRHTFRSGGAGAGLRMIHALEWTDNWIFTPAPLVTILTGVLMVMISDAWGFGQPWIYLTVALIVVEFSRGSFELKRLRSAVELDESDPELDRALGSYLRFAPLAVAMLGVALGLMVFKPGV